MKECTYGSVEGALQKETKQKSTPWTVSQADSVSRQENYEHKCCPPAHPLFVSCFELSFKLFGVFPLSSFHSATPDRKPRLSFLEELL